MIRVRIRTTESIPDSLVTVLKKSEEVQIVDDNVSADVILIYTKFWRPSSLKQLHPMSQSFTKPAVIICEQVKDTFRTESVLRQNICGILTLQDSPEKILTGLQAAAAGWKVVHPSVNANQQGSRLPSLTPREMEILRLIADGEGNKSIAYLLEISEHTVKFHISSIFEKLHVSSRTEAVKAGITSGLISI